MAKYVPLYDYLLSRQHLPKVRMTFAEVAVVLGEPLPNSAFTYREWWANQSNTTNRQWAAAWLDAGFSVEDVSQESAAGWVVFTRQHSSRNKQSSA